MFRLWELHKQGALMSNYRFCGEMWPFSFPGFSEFLCKSHSTHAFLANNFKGQCFQGWWFPSAEGCVSLSLIATSERNFRCKRGISKGRINLSGSILMTVCTGCNKINSLSCWKASFYWQQWPENSGQRALLDVCEESIPLKTNSQCESNCTTTSHFFHTKILNFREERYS